MIRMSCSRSCWLGCGSESSDNACAYRPLLWYYIYASICVSLSLSFLEIFISSDIERWSAHFICCFGFRCGGGSEHQRRGTGSGWRALATKRPAWSFLFCPPREATALKEDKKRETQRRRKWYYERKEWRFDALFTLFSFLFFLLKKKMYIAAGSAYKYAWCKGRERASRWPGDVSLSLSLSLFLLLLQWKLTYQRPFYAKKEFLYWCKDTQVCNARTRSIEIAKNCLKKRQCEGNVAVRCKVN